MDPILPSYYRLRLNEALQNRLDLPADTSDDDTTGDILFSDVLTMKTIANRQPPAADPGEAKHVPFDKKTSGDFAPNTINIKRLDPASEPQSADYARSYREQSRIDASDLRKKMEDRIRRCKRASSPCPFKDDNGQCGMPFVRCGDRLQFSMRETGVERQFFHRCTYDWRNRGENVLIVDDDPTMLDFCKSSFALFLNFDAEKIVTASSAAQAIDLLARSKVEGRKFGLVISDIVMPGRSGFDLVSELYNRNFDVEVVLMREAHELPVSPPDYRGEVEVLPNIPFVTTTLIKPFHSETLVAEVRKLRFGWER
jgi:CheY-like chemotaxis protein